jgi:hypothetical protein
VCHEKIKPGEHYRHHTRLNFTWHSSHDNASVEKAAGEEGITGHTLLMGRVPDVS